MGEQLGVALVTTIGSVILGLATLLVPLLRRSKPDPAPAPPAADASTQDVSFLLAEWRRERDLRREAEADRDRWRELAESRGNRGSRRAPRKGEPGD